MAYEWDARKARRAYLLKFGASWLIAFALAAIPVWVAMKAGAI